MARAKQGHEGRVLFWCPGCEDVHAIHTRAGGWTWNGDAEHPTFSPSVLYNGVQWGPADEFFKPNHRGIPPGGSIVCHSFVTDGRIQFLGDCTHILAGQTVDLPEWPHGDAR